MAWRQRAYLPLNSNLACSITELFQEYLKRFTCTICMSEKRTLLNGVPQVLDTGPSGVPQDELQALSERAKATELTETH
jgi:hypothetical protein